MSGYPERKMSESVQSVNHTTGTEKSVPKLNKCACGCGKFISKTWFRGHNKKGVFPPNKQGYTIFKNRMFIKMPIHPNSNNKGYIRRSHLVIEANIGRYLTKSEVVHHINGDTFDDRIENLKLMSKKDHDRLSVLVSMFCLSPFCYRPHKARGLCGVHYNRLYRRNLPLPLNPSRGNKWTRKNTG